jgi:WS/DGAT/MGAT family acyltransferase
MERLSFIDQVLHKIGVSGLPGIYMQGAMIVDPAASPFEINAMIIAEHIAARLHTFPILRKKLVQDPLKIGDLRLIDDPDFDVWDHITFASLPSPGDQRRLDHHLGEFSARSLNYDRPLWTFEIIEGLEGGKIAVAQKLSHATMDGMAAMTVMQSIFDVSPTAPDKLDLSKAPTTAGNEPGKMTLVGTALKENVQRLSDTPKTLFSLSKMLTKTASESVNNWLESDDTADSDNVDKKQPAAAPTTSLNGKISSDKRTVGVAMFKVTELKALSKAFDCKLNDICLTLASEALANYFKNIGEKVDFDLTLVMPISTRSEASREHGNELALANINAHNRITSIVERLEAIKHDTQAAKTSQSEKAASGGSGLGEITNILSPLVIDIIAVLLKSLNPWEKIKMPGHCVLSNIAGPRETLYFAGMPIEYQIPMIALFHKAGLSIGATSMGDTLSFGFHACGRVVKEKNMRYLVEGINKAFNELQEAAIQTSKSASKLPAKKNASGKTAPPKAKAELKAKPKSKAKPKAKTSAKAKVKEKVKAKPTASKKPAAVKSASAKKSASAAKRALAIKKLTTEKNEV